MAIDRTHRGTNFNPACQSGEKLGRCRLKPVSVSCRVRIFGNGTVVSRARSAGPRSILGIRVRMSGTGVVCLRWKKLPVLQASPGFVEEACKRVRFQFAPAATVMSQLTVIIPGALERWFECSKTHLGEGGRMG